VIDSMFRRIEKAAVSLRFEFEGRMIEAVSGESLAAALLAAGISPLRETPVSGAPRAPYCMMGVCFDCLVEVDGVPNRQACLMQVGDGMVVRRQRGARLFGDAVDGLDAPEADA
jgi:predicted molibdopterin-dependent oxidoreductase YjgC